MFIVGKKIENCNNVIRTVVGDNNINMINDYFNNYYEVCYNDQSLKVKTDIAAKADRTFQGACFNGIGMLPYLQFARFNSLAREADRANDDVRETRKELELSVLKLGASSSDIKDSDIYERLERAHNAHVFCKYINPCGTEVTEDDMLLDLVLNNELDLIKDYFDDYRTFNFDIRLAKVRDTSFINHDIEKLDLRFRNIILQNELIKDYQNSDVDASVMYGIISESYDLLNKSINDGVSQSDLDAYEETFDFNIPFDSKVNAAFKKYIDVTKSDVLKYGKIKETPKKRVK